MSTRDRREGGRRRARETKREAIEGESEILEGEIYTLLNLNNVIEFQ